LAEAAQNLEVCVEANPGEITLLLASWKDGEPGAFEKLIPLVYPHLRKVAAGYVRRERGPGEIQATSLVNELCLRLLNQRNAAWEDRAHFYAFSAKVMRMILIDHARERQAQRRGAGAEHTPLHEDIPWVGLGSLELIDLNRALDALAAIDASKAQMVELRYFLGCTAEETAALMNVSKATVDRELKYSRAWLYQRIEPDKSKNPPAS
jgi:RNA polymerase sigma factor (TIGR02999 family)